MSERTLIDYTLRGMHGLWLWPCKHADPYTPGVADMSAYVLGAGNVWIEAKALERWPVRADTVVKLTRFTDDQRMFLVQRRGFLFLRAGREYLLFHGREAIMQAGRLTREQLTPLACGHWIGSVEWQQFADTIIKQRPNA